MGQRNKVQVIKEIKSGGWWWYGGGGGGGVARGALESIFIPSDLR